MQRLITPQLLLTFLLGGIALGVLGHAVTHVLTQYFGTTNSAMASMIGSALLVLAGIAARLSHLARRSNGH